MKEEAREKRKRRASNTTLGAFLGVRLAEEEKRAFEELANELRMSPAELLRLTIRTLINKNETLNALERAQKLLNLRENEEEKEKKKGWKGLFCLR